MKSLKNYIVEESLIFENIDGEIIVEGFWEKLGSLFGYNIRKVANVLSKLSQKVKNIFTAGQYIGAKSKDKDVKTAAKEIASATEKSSDESLSELAKNVEFFSKQDLSKYENDENTLGFTYYLYSNLDTLSDELNKPDEKKIAEKLKANMEKYKIFDKAQKIYNEQFLTKVEKSGVNKTLEQEENTDNKKSDAQKEVNNETTEVITDNKDLLSPLAQKAGVKGDVLRNFVSAKLRKTLDDKLAKKGSREAIQKALGEDVILGTSIMVLGALITKDESKIKAICEQIGSNVEELQNNLSKYEKQYNK